MSEITVTLPQTPRHGLGIWLVPPFLVGLALRFGGLRAQVLTGDELHSVHGALAMPVEEILRSWTFGDADYCVPLTAAYRLLMDQGVVFSEIGFRMPSLIAGLMAIAFLPLLASARIGPRAAILFAWLIAISPMLVFYSRIMRSYMPATLAAGVAVLLFDRWLRQRDRRAVIGWVICGAAAVYLHLAAIPLVIAPLLYAAGRAAMRPSRVPEWRALLLPAAGLALAIAVLLFPARESLLEVMRAKRDGQLPSVFSWIGVLRLQLGTKEWLIALLAFTLGARGALVLWRTQRDFLAYLAILVAAQIVGLMILSPDRLQERAVLNRYLLVVLPLGLIPIARGLSAPWSPRRKDVSEPEAELGGWSILAISTVALLGWFMAGPIAPHSLYWSSPFSNALSAVDFLGDGNRIPADSTPRFYLSLADSNERATLIEYPWQNLANHAFDAYQRTHGGDVIVSSLIERTSESRIALRNRAEPTPEGFLASRARYLVVHNNLRTESGRVVSSDMHHRTWLRAREQLWEPLRRAAKVMSRRLERKWGPPSYDDDMIRVWDLDLVRAREREGV